MAHHRHRNMGDGIGGVIMCENRRIESSKWWCGSAAAGRGQRQLGHEDHALRDNRHGGGVEISCLFILSLPHFCTRHQHVCSAAARRRGGRIS